MTISEMVITAMVASPATVYLECEGKRYRDAVELANEHGDRFVRSAQILSGGGIKIELEPQEVFDLKSLLDLPDTIGAGTIEAPVDDLNPEELAFPPGFPEELGVPDYEGDGELADAYDPGTIDPRDWTPEELAFEPDGLLDGPPPAEEVLGANE